MRKIIGLMMAVMMIVGTMVAGNAQEKEMVDVNMVDDYSYEIEYDNGEKEKVEFDNELDAVEEYSNVWYEIHDDDENLEVKKVDVKIIDDYSFEIIYADGEKTIHTFDTELECAEEYSNTWYEIQENLAL